MEAKPQHFWLRAEVKPGERRTPLLPEHAAQLVSAGHTVTVEASNTRCVKDLLYHQVGCSLAPEGSWRTLAPSNALILGLKELDLLESESYPLHHRHIYFGHCYKNQAGWKELLQRFIRGDGSLLDLELLTHENGARVAAFGRSAGFIGMATAVLTWCHQQKQARLNRASSELPPLNYYSDFASLVQSMKTELGEVSALQVEKPRVLIIGALGRCGQGATSFAKQIGFTEGVDLTLWDINETKGRGPFPEIIRDYDILVNCIYLVVNPNDTNSSVKPFLTKQLLNQHQNRKLSVVCDVSCDASNPYNPIPIYSGTTTFSKPTTRVGFETSSSHQLPLDVIAIDHLPSLVPYESSSEFSAALIDHLLQCDQSEVWKRCKKVFLSKAEPVMLELRKSRQHIWLRDETQEMERRTPITPRDAKQLINQGFIVTVERSDDRVFTNEEYEEQGCQMVDSGSWKAAPLTATILGLQGIPNEDQVPLKHQHICFGYAYKQQSGWRELLTRFVEGSGALLDIEYLTDSKGRRLTTFAAIAGHIAMATGLLTWCHQQLHPSSATGGTMKRSRSRDQLQQLASADDIDKSVPLLEYIRSQLSKAMEVNGGQAPLVIVIGGKGRVGTGAVTFAQKLGLQVTIWGRNETQIATEKGIPRLLEYDILINAIKLDQTQSKPFLTTELISASDRNLSIIVDISCDVYNPRNPLSIYHSTTSFSAPTSRIIADPENPLDIVAIENLATLLPRESSSHFSSQLLPHLLHIADSSYPVWTRALQVFKEKTTSLRARSIFANNNMNNNNATTSAVPILQLPTDFPRPNIDPYQQNSLAPERVGQVSLTLSDLRLSDLRALADSLNTEIFTLVLATIEILLHRLTAEENFTLGLIQSSSAANNIPSLCSIYTNLTPSLLWNDFCSRVQNAIKSQELFGIPLPTNVADLNPFSLVLKDHPPNFQVLVARNPGTDQSFLNYGLSWFDLIFSCSSLPNEAPLTLTLFYRADLFLMVRAQHILYQMDYLLQQIAANSRSTQISKYSLIVPENNPVASPAEPLDATWEGTVTDHFHRNALAFPNRIAAVHGTSSLTYRELDEISSQLANCLVAKGMKVEDGAFIWSHRNLCVVWAYMGVLKAGGSVSLMDPVYPNERIINCLKVAQPKVWISIEAAGPVPQEVLDFLPSIGCTIHQVLPVPQRAKELGVFSEFSTEFDFAKAHQARAPLGKENVAVVTFTSGSTGLPKAVLGRHGPLTHFYPWMRQRFQLSEGDHFSMCSGISHDPLQRDIFTPLYLGATIHVPDAEDIATPGRLAVWMKSQGITVTHLTPAMGQLLSETVVDNLTVDTLRVALFVGDKLTKRDVIRLRRVAPQVLCVNMYGSTETQRAVSYYPVPDNQQLASMKEILPVGSGMKDVQLVILNGDSKQCGVGELGEIYVRSPHLARGYKGLEEQTREKFFPNPFRNDPEDRFYRTGDLGRYMIEGSVDVQGRADNQVKIRGFRIELGEINTMLSHHPSVKENIPLVREDVPNDKRIVAYVVPQVGKLLPPGHELRRFLENKLPNYMIPSAFVVLKSLPLTPNGKINTGALPPPERMPTSRIDKQEPAIVSESIVLNERIFFGFWKEMFPDINLEPRNGSMAFADADQVKIAVIWRDLLGSFDFGANDNFFDLGGHSLMATRLMFLIKRTFGLDLPLDVLLKNPSISGIAQALSSSRQSGSRSLTKDQDIHEFLQSEVTSLDPLIKPMNANRVAPSSTQTSASTPKDVLLTGATGFVGVFLLKMLLDSTPESTKIHCLVRAPNSVEGKQRLQQALRVYKVWKDSYENRIIPVLGDLAQPLLGLSRDSFEKLASAVDVILHNGAFVHWIYPYERLKPANVLGTLEIIRLALTSRIKPLHYISTTAVFDHRKTRTPEGAATQIIYENDPLSDAVGLCGGYAQSKWVAEKLVALARSRGVPVNVYRPSFISGDETNGIWTTDDFLCRLVKGCLEMGSYPDIPNGKLHIASVDFVTRAVVQILLASFTAGAETLPLINKCYHLTGDQTLPFHKIFESVQNFGYPTGQLTKVPYSAWRNRLLESVTSASSSNSNNPLEPVITVFTPDYPSELELNLNYDNSNLKAVLPHLSASGVVSLMPLYLSYFIRSGFLSAPSQTAGKNSKATIEDSAVELVTLTNRTK